MKQVISLPFPPLLRLILEIRGQGSAFGHEQNAFIDRSFACWDDSWRLCNLAVDYGTKQRRGMGETILYKTHDSTNDFGQTKRPKSDGSAS